MKSKDYVMCLELAKECAIVRAFVDHAKYHAHPLSDEFSAVCKHLNHYQRVNLELIQHYGKGKQRFIAKLNQAISRAPRIRFWA